MHSLPSTGGVVGVDVAVVGDSDKGVVVVCVVVVVGSVVGALGDSKTMSSRAIASSALLPQNA